MDYVIANPNNTVYIKLDNGRPVTCAKQERQKFDYVKASNVASHLPKTMHKFHFQVKAISVSKNKETINSPPQQYIKKVSYVVPNEVQRWLDKVKELNGLANEATDRKRELLNDLSIVDRELSNCLHNIELSARMNACNGYKQYRQVKDVLEKRRIIKDELSVVESVLTSNLSSVASDHVQKVIDKLQNRRFVIRDVELNNGEVG